MHILELRSENFKRLRAVQITPEGHIVQITGANGEGKTSCLDSIWAALGGKDAVPDEPIRKGKKSARIEVKLGGAAGAKYVVERTFTAKGTYLKVTDPAGGEHNKPQTILDGLMGAIGFDAPAFMRMPAREQFEMLRGIVKLDVDLDALDRRRAAIYEERTGLNRDVVRAKGLADAISVPDDLPETEPDIEALTSELAGISERNELVAKWESGRQAVADRQSAAAQKIDEYKKLLAEAEREFEFCTDQLASIDAGEKPERQDPAEVKARLDAARQISKGFRLQEKKIEALAAVSAAERAVQAATDAIDQIDAEKQRALAGAQMPVEGLSFADGVVLFNGIPVSQASAAEQLRISVAIGAALNPQLRVILCRDGSLLDSKSMKQLGEFAEANDLQVWIERVDESGAVGVVIEDGHVRGQEALVEEVEQKNADAPPVDDERLNRARKLLASSLDGLRASATVLTADKLNATIKTKLANFPDLVAKEWNPAYLARVKELQQ